MHKPYKGVKIVKRSSYVLGDKAKLKVINSRCNKKVQIRGKDFAKEQAK